MRIKAITILIFFSLCIHAKDFNIEIKTQEKYDNISYLINKILGQQPVNHEDININIQIKKGIYYFNKPHIIQNDKIEKQNIKLTIRGDSNGETFIISKGKQYTLQDIIDKTELHNVCKIQDYHSEYGFINQNFKKIDITSTADTNTDQINFSPSSPHVVDKQNKIIRIELPKELSYLKNKGINFFQNSIMYISTQWFDTIVKNLYTDSIYAYGNYLNNNAIELGYFDNQYKLKTRIYITNIIKDNKIPFNKILINNDQIYIPKDITTIYTMENTQAFVFKNLEFKSIELSRLNFAGNSYNAKSSLITFFNCKNININNNIFNNIQSNIISINGNYDTKYPNKYYSSNITLMNNKYYDNGSSVCVITNSENITVTNNYSINNGILRKNFTFMIPCKNFYFKNNKIINFPCNALYISNTREATKEISGIIEYNEFYNDSLYNAFYKKNGMIDVGVIYSGCHNTNTIIRNNIIHDFHGYGNARGIFLDSGAYNITIEGNLIYNIKAGYAVDSRFVKPYGRQIQPTNTSNYLKNNIIIGNFKWMGNPSYPNQTFISNNIYYCSRHQKNITNNACILKENHIDSTLHINTKNKVIISPTSFKYIRKTISPYIKKRISIHE